MGDSAAPHTAEHDRLTDARKSAIRIGLSSGSAVPFTDQDVRALLAEVEDLGSRLACVVEATYWDRPYDTRLAAIRGMCDLTTNGMTPRPAEVKRCPRCGRPSSEPLVKGKPYWTTDVCSPCNDHLTAEETDRD